MTLLDRIKTLCKEKGVSQSQMERELGISNGSSSKWHNSSPSSPVLEKLSIYFDVSSHYLMTGEEKEGDKYYLNEETARIAQEIFESNELRMLFKTSRDIAPERLKAYHDMMVRMEKLEHGEGD